MSLHAQAFHPMRSHVYPDEKAGGEAVAGEEQPKTEEQIKAEEAEAEKAFAAGFAKVSGGVEETQAGAQSDEGEDDEAAKAQAEADAKKKAEDDAAAKATADDAAKKEAEEKAKREAEEAEWAGISPGVRKRIEALDSVPGAVAKLAGHLGGFKRQIDSITATAQAAAEKKEIAAPTKVEVEEALQDPTKWAKLQEDFPEWMGPVASELTRLRKDMKTAIDGVQAAIPKASAPAQQQQIDTGKIVAEAEERAYVRLKHPDWKAICASPDFAKRDAKGAITGGWLATAPEDIRAKAASDAAEDAIAVFDAYKAHRATAAAAAAEQAKKTQRLERAAPPKGRAEPPSQGISDDDAFERGFKRVRGGTK